ncbi:MAG: ribulokinase [Balneolaceae bacterium]
MTVSDSHIIGLDFGTDSVRGLLVSANGTEIAHSVHQYERWSREEFCNRSENRFRQHPADYLESMEAVLSGLLSGLSAHERNTIRAISVDTTGSTPVAVDKSGTPLALKSDFRENPNAMFILWKDHTAIEEAELINRLSRDWHEGDYTRYVGGIYSSEWFWAKILHTLRIDPKVRDTAWSWVEHCDWIPFELSGGMDVSDMKRSRCAAGHKAMWHEKFGGLPSEEFLTALDPLLSGIRSRLYSRTVTADKPAGTISKKWAGKLGLPETVVIGSGAFDAHMGAVGGEIEPYYLSKVMGTSTCDMLIVPPEDLQGKLVKGICGQVDGSVIPGMIGLEAGQSAFGDVYAWFRDLMAWPVERVISGSGLIDEETKQKLLMESSEMMIRELSLAAEDVRLEESGVVALDWLNGRRTPDADQSLKAAVTGLDLGTDTPKLFRAFVESTCFGARAIVERFKEEGIPIRGLIGMGGVAKKSPFVMQTLADVLRMPIRIVRSGETCALGAAMFGAVAAGLFDTVEEAMASMGSGFGREYHPDETRSGIYEQLYQRYQQLGGRIENGYD